MSGVATKVYGNFDGGLHGYFRAILAYGTDGGRSLTSIK